LAALPDQLFIAVNVSAATLGRAPYGEHVLEALLLADVEPSRLHIEVTETMLLDPVDSAARTIRQLADAGVQWYIDDFGTGYASITSLRDLPMSGLKLDRSFTYGITSQERTSMQLAQALVGLASGLDLDTVAEGVERREQADHLRSLGWSRGQGWLYGKAAPLPVH
jgi:EAL domain-containing protein (putative c-di-GMP-specific phosphodiesterase class I)